MDGLIASTNMIKTLVVESENDFKDVGLDWLAFTYLPENENKEVSYDLNPLANRKKLPIDYFWELFGERFHDFVRHYGECLNHGKHYYSRCITVKCPRNNDLKCKGYTTDFQILFTVPDDKNDVEYAYKMGVNVSIPSHFLRAFFRLIGFDFDDLKTFFKFAKLNNIKFSRIDICWDDYSKTYTPHDYEADYICKNIISSFQNHNFYASKHDVGGTFQLGNRETKLLRIYDKDYESNGAIPAIRYEFMYTGKWARSFAELIIKNGLKIDFKGLILDWFRVIGSQYVFNFNVNRNQMETRSDWLEFLKGQFSEELQEVKVRPLNTKDIKHINLKTLDSYIRYVYTFQKLFGLDAYNDRLEIIRDGPMEFTPSLLALYNSSIVLTI